MSSKEDKTRLATKLLVRTATAAGAVGAAALGVPVWLCAVAKSVLDWTHDVVVSASTSRPELETIVTRIRAERAAHKIDLIEDVLTTWAGLKPEYSSALDELADAVSDADGAVEDERFVAALLRLFGLADQSRYLFCSIKEDTAAIRQETADLKAGQDRIEVSLEEIRSGAHAVPSDTDRTGATAASAATPALMQVQQHQIAALSAENRKLLDQDGKRRWDAVDEAVRWQEWDEAVRLAEELETWLNSQGSKVSEDVRAEAVLLLADVAVIRGLSEGQGPSGTSEARACLEKALGILGTQPKPELAERAVRVRAKLDFMDGKQDDALESLAELDSPGAISSRLAMLIDLGRHEEASSLVQGKPVHRRWADSAITAHLRSGNREEADRALTWAKDGQDRTTLSRCALAYAGETYSAVVARRQHHASVAAAGPTADERADLERALSEVSFVIEDPLESGSAPTALQKQGLHLALLAHRALGNRPECKAAADALLRAEPADLEVARVVLWRFVPCPNGFTDRLLAEHPTCLDAHLLAASIDVEVLGQPERALRQLLGAQDLAVSEAEKVELSKCVILAAQGCDEQLAESALGLVQEALGGGHEVTQFFRAHLALRQKNVKEAAKIQEATRDEGNPIWLQLAAAVAVAQGDWAQAADWFERAAYLTGHPDLFDQAAHSLYRAGDVESNADRIAKNLAATIRLDPSNEAALRNLARLRHSKGDFRSAAGHYHELLTRRPDDVTVAMDLARNLALAGEREAACDVLQSFCARDEAPLEPVLMRAHLLRTLGKPKSALASLGPHKARFGNDHRFLLALLQLGYAAEEESEANEALARLVEMRREGTIGDEVLQPGNIDDLLEYARKRQLKAEEIADAYAAGRMPWLLVSKWFGPSNDAYLAWRIRTQDVVFADDRGGSAAYVLYATNSFTADEVDRPRMLVPIEAPPSSKPIVADISALLTLHRLGLLGQACQCFGTVLVPATYAAYWLSEQANMEDSQPSQMKAREAIVRAIDEKRISVVSNVAAATDRPIPILDEYRSEGEKGFLVLRIRQVANGLAAAGHLGAVDMRRLEGISHATPLVDDEQASRSVAKGRLLADSLTLRTLHQIGLLDSFVKGLRLEMKEDQVDELRRELANARWLEETRGSHRDLVKKVQAESSFEMVTLLAGDTDEQQADSDAHYATDAARLAVARELPLLADDRFCQMVVLNTVGTRASAFGTDVLVDSLAAEGLIDERKRVNSWLQLIRWRYRFLLPPVDVLLTIAGQFKEGLPGRGLREIGNYAHDCMRDLGLFGGPEPTDPPLSLAAKLYSAWIDRLAAFCLRAWLDDRFTDSQAECLVRWALTECLPPPPKVVPSGARRNLAAGCSAVLVMSAFHHCLTACASAATVDKAHQAVRCIREVLDLSDDEFSASLVQPMKVVAEGEYTDEEKKTVGTILLRMLRVAYGPSPSIDVRILPLAEQYGLLGKKSEGELPSSGIVDAIRSDDCKARLDAPKGPFVFLRDDTGRGVRVIFVPEMLVLPHQPSRLAALHYLSQAELFPSPATRALMQEASDSLLSNESGRWVDATCAIVKAVQADFQLNVAGVRQGIQMGCEDAQKRCWKSVVWPSVSSMLATDRDGFSLFVDPDKGVSEMQQELGACDHADALLARYDSIAGHLPLAEPLDLGTQVHRCLEWGGKPDEVSAALWKWVENNARPWRRYHGCQALLSNPDLIPSGKLAEFWNAIGEVVFTVSDRGSDSLCARRWQLHSFLASSYLQYLELRSFGIRTDRLVSVAWWCAREVTETLVGDWRASPTSDGAIAELQTALEQNFLLTKAAWLWLRPRAECLPCREATVYLASPWGMALLLELGTSTELVTRGDVPPSVVTGVWEAFVRCLGHLARTAGKPDEAAPWVWSRSLFTAARGFLDALPEDAKPEGSADVLSLFEESSSPEHIEDMLKCLMEGDQEEASFVATRIRDVCSRDQAAGEALWQRMGDTEWREACWRRLSEFPRLVLADALLRIQADDPAQKAFEGPRLWASTAIAVVGDEERARMAIRLLLMSCIAGLTTAPLKHLLRQRESLSLRGYLADERTELRKLYSLYPDPYVKSCVTDVLAALADA